MPAPLLMRRDELTTVQLAAYRTGKDEKTIRRWCKQYGIARQTSKAAPLEISMLGLEMVLHGDLEALQLLRAGQRTAPAVRRYVEHLGLPG